MYEILDIVYVYNIYNLYDIGYIIQYNLCIFYMI